LQQHLDHQKAACVTQNKTVPNLKTMVSVVLLSFRTQLGTRSECADIKSEILSSDYIYIYGSIGKTPVA
jgi:hypothetical protein